MLRTGSQRLVAAVLDCEKPVIVELHGAAAGIGAHLVLAADFVVAAEGSPADRGLRPAGASCPTAAAPTCYPEPWASPSPSGC